MKFDAVHDLQNIYRKILTSMSRPGQIENIDAVGQKLRMEIAADKNLTALLMTLLDGEVRFCFAAQADKQAADKINQLTYAVQTQAAQADYIVVTKDTKPQELAAALEQARVGTLSDPHDSATVVIEVQELSNSYGLMLRGPGIKDYAELQVRTSHEWLAARNSKVAEFPLGIDLILLDARGNIACLPRSTRITRQEAR